MHESLGGLFGGITGYLGGSEVKIEALEIFDQAVNDTVDIELDTQRKIAEAKARVPEELRRKRGEEIDKAVEDVFKQQAEAKARQVKLKIKPSTKPIIDHAPTIGTVSGIGVGALVGHKLARRSEPNTREKEDVYNKALRKLELEQQLEEAFESGYSLGEMEAIARTNQKDAVELQKLRAEERLKLIEELSNPSPN